VVAKPVEMVAYVNAVGEQNPIKFRYKDDNENLKVIKVDKVLHKTSERIVGKETLIFSCQSKVNETYLLYELRYQVHDCRWILWKI
jgi:hypothetical protein